MSGYVARLGWWAVLGTIRKAADIYYGASCARYFAFGRGEWARAARSFRSMFDTVRPARRRARKYYRLAWRVQQARRTSPTRRALECVFKAVADPEKVVWIRPEDITHKVVYDLSLFGNDVLPGDWDLKLRALDVQPKHQGIVQRFRDGAEWGATNLFTGKYVAEIGSGVAIRGSEDLGALEHHYEAHFDDLYSSIRDHGLQVSVDENGFVDLPHVHVGRDGRMLFGRDGNHRLMMAKLLGVARIPCRVHARHLAWQQIRERVAALGSERCWREVDPDLATHPDLADLLQRDDAPADAHLDVAAARIPSLYGTRHGLLLRRLANEARAGTAVVQVGAWLGAGTAQLARGIGERAGSGDVRLLACDEWRVSPTDVKEAAQRGVLLTPGEDLVSRVQHMLSPFGVPVNLVREAGTVGGWEGKKIALYVDEATAAPDLRARCAAWCAGSWIPGETILVAFGQREPLAAGAPTAQVLLPCLAAAHPGSFTLLEETERYKVFRYTEMVDTEKLATAARIWSLTVTAGELQREIENTRRSRSWRITAPLRYCAALVRSAMPRWRRWPVAPGWRA